MKKSILQSAYRIAKEKLSTHPEYENFPHYSFIVQKNKIIEWATNANWEPPVHWGYNRKNEFGFVSKYHAEIFSWKKAKGLIGNNPFEIINIRLNKKGVLRLSKPCSACYYLMKELNCHKFYYSSDLGFLELK